MSELGAYEYVAARADSPGVAARKLSEMGVEAVRRESLVVGEQKY